MNYTQLHKQLTRRFFWVYFFRLDYEEIRDCISEAIEDYLIWQSFGNIAQNPKGWVYRVAERKIKRRIHRNGRNPQESIDETDIEDTLTIEDIPNIHIVKWEDWKFDETEMVVTKKGVMYVRIQSDLSQKLYALFLKYLKGNCLVIFLYMLIGWKDEEIQIEMEQRTIEVFRQTRYDCMKRLRAKLIESGDWDDLFGRKWGKLFEDKNKKEDDGDDDDEE